MNNAGTWRRRSAMMYTVGTWTLLGFFGLQSYFFMWKKKDEDGQEQPREEPKEIPDGFSKTVSEDRLIETTTYRIPGKSFYVTTTVAYKPNFVPYTTRLYNYMQSTRLYNYVQSCFEDTSGKEK